MIGQTLGHYRILEQIGAGGMGVVYRAHDERLDRDVALKVLPQGVLADEAARKRFRKEALALSQLNHPHIATIYDFDTQDGADFLVMEYLPGGSLAERLAAGSFSEKEVAALGGQIASALEEAHEKDIVHRDLKPGNVAITPKGQAKVLDFGLARVLRPGGEFSATASLTDSHAAAGTYLYMPPEQLRGEPVDARADIYALGVVLYEMATGQLPFREESAPRLTEAILHQPPVAPRALNSRVSLELERIILKCLEKDAENRYQSAKEVGVDLRRLTSPSTVTAAVPVSRPVSRRYAVLWVAATIVALAAALVALDVGGLRSRLFGGSPGKIESIAVLPLENLSGDPEQEYMADGMTEALIADLAQISALRVISRTSVMQYKGARKPLPVIAKELSVDAVVEGSVQRSGNRVRVTVQLIDASSDRHLWAQTFERDFSDILSLQSDFARAIVGEIRVQLTPKEQARLAGTRPVNPEAHEAYLKGRFYFYKLTSVSVRKGFDYFQLAIQKDPGYALAYVGLARCYLAGTYLALLPREAVPKAKEAIQRALELDDTLGDAHAALAGIKMLYDWDWPGAEREIKRALELSPGSPDAHAARASYLTAMGQVEGAIAERKRALELDPLTVIRSVDVGRALYFARRYDEAVEQYQRAMELDPNYPWAHFFQALALYQMGRYDEFAKELRTWAIVTGDQRHREIAPVIEKTYASGGHLAVWLTLAEWWKAGVSAGTSQSTSIAMIYGTLGDKEQALTWLEKAYQERPRTMIFIKVEPNLDSIRSDPRFRDIVRRMGLPP